MPKVCLRNAKVCPRYAVDMPTTYLRYAGTCIKYARDMPKLCLRYAIDMPKICPIYAKVFPRCAQDVPKIKFISSPSASSVSMFGITHFSLVFIANLKNDAIYAFYLESFCDNNLAIRKVFAFSNSEAHRLLFKQFKVVRSS